MMLRALRTVALVCVALALPALAATTQDAAAPGQPPALRARGQISDIDRTDWRITVDGAHGSRTFSISPDTLVLSTAARETFEDLAVGDEVLVQAAANDAGQAQFVEVLEPDEMAMEIKDLPPIDVADTATVKGLDPLGTTLLVSSEDGPRGYRITQLTRVHTPTGKLPLHELRPGERVVVTARDRHGILEALDVLVVAGPPASGQSG